VREEGRESEKGSRKEMERKVGRKVEREGRENTVSSPNRAVTI
jgi:hypothetical protein